MALTAEWTWGTTKTHGLAVGDSFEYGGDDLRAWIPTEERA